MNLPEVLTSQGCLQELKVESRYPKVFAIFHQGRGIGKGFICAYKI